MNRRFVMIFLGAILGGCAGPQTAPIQVQPEMIATVTIDQALARVFSALDQKSAMVDPMAKEVIPPPLSGALGGRLDGLRARMDRRIAALDLLKALEIVGENDRGYLEARGNITPEQEALRSDENADRREIFSELAVQAKESVERVGRLRAQRIAVWALRGAWLQSPDGVWYQKQ